MSVSPGQFRDGMRHLAASVTILATAHEDGARFGMTATAVCSVSAEPPMLLCCINRDNQTRDAFAAAGHFSVNLLGTDSQHLADRFARRMMHEERFQDGRWRLHEAGVPVLGDAMAWFACRLAETVEIASHTVFFGEVIDIGTGTPPASPLLYAHGGYGSFAAAHEAPPRARQE